MQSSTLHGVTVDVVSVCDDGTVVEWHIVIQEFLEGIQLLLVWQLTREQ